MNNVFLSKLKTRKWQVDYRGSVSPVLDPRPTALSSLTNLNYLDLDGNPLSSEQKTLITE
jgi:hypothetical protein